MLSTIITKNKVRQKMSCSILIKSQINVRLYAHLSLIFYSPSPARIQVCGQQHPHVVKNAIKGEVINVYTCQIYLHIYTSSNCDGVVR